MDMSTTTPPQTGADVMAQFIPQSPFVAKLGIVAEVLDGDEVRLRLPWDETNVTVGDMVHGETKIRSAGIVPADWERNSSWVQPLRQTACAGAANSRRSSVAPWERPQPWSSPRV